METSILGAAIIGPPSLGKKNSPGSPDPQSLPGWLCGGATGGRRAAVKSNLGDLWTYDMGILWRCLACNSKMCSLVTYVCLKKAVAYGKSGNSKIKMFCSLRKFMVRVMFDEEHEGKVSLRSIKSVRKSQRTLLHPLPSPTPQPRARRGSDSVASCRCASAREDLIAWHHVGVQEKIW